MGIVYLALYKTNNDSNKRASRKTHKSKNYQKDCDAFLNKLYLSSLRKVDKSKEIWYEFQLPHIEQIFENKIAKAENFSKLKRIYISQISKLKICKVK